MRAAGGEEAVTTPIGTNWAGNYAYRARVLHRPASLAEVQRIVAAAPRVRVLGSRHSFTDIADSDELVSLDALPPDIVVDRAAGTVTFAGGLRYGDLVAALAAEGMALHNLASLPHISVAGAVATATHGSGDRSGSLATAVVGLELVTSGGDVLAARRGDPDFDGMVVGLGALGAVTRIELAVEPAYDVRQRVFEGLAWDALFAHFDEVMSSGDSVSVFTRWGAEAEAVWVKSRVDRGGGGRARRPARRARGDRRPQSHPGHGPRPRHRAARRPGPVVRPAAALPHGLHAEQRRGDPVGVPGARAATRCPPSGRCSRWATRSGRSLHMCEIRSMAADALWMSPQYGRDTIGLHFTWKREPAAVLRVLADVEAALAPFAPRPHWGKVFVAGAAEIAPRYERLPDFRRLAERLDPRGAFRNAWLESRVLG